MMVVGLLQEVGTQRRVGLLGVPRAIPAEGGYQLDKALEIVGDDGLSLGHDPSRARAGAKGPGGDATRPTAASQVP